jgi:hypothetical protein
LCHCLESSSQFCVICISSPQFLCHCLESSSQFCVICISSPQFLCHCLESSSQFCVICISSPQFVCHCLESSSQFCVICISSPQFLSRLFYFIISVFVSSILGHHLRICDIGMTLPSQFLCHRYGLSSDFVSSALGLNMHSVVVMSSQPEVLCPLFELSFSL